MVVGMNKYILGIEGMRCGMCEMHVEDTIRKSYPTYKKVKASRFSNTVIVIIPDEISEEEFIAVFKPTGYRITSYQKTAAVKKLFSWR